MEKLSLSTLVIFLSYSSAHAISKEEFLKLPEIQRMEFVTVVGISPEYAIPREEFMKLSFEVRSAIAFEKGRMRVQYAIANIGKKMKDLDTSRLYDLGMSPPKLKGDEIITNGTIARKYHGSCQNHFKSAEYFYKDYLEWKKSELGQPSLWQSGGGDEHPLSWILKLYSDYQMYDQWDKLYSDYHNFRWMRLAKGKTIKEKKESLKNNADYFNFMDEWNRVKKLAKTTRPKPLSVQVQNHEWFYSDKQEEVLKALEYYQVNKVKFMLEKALTHKDPVVASKAKEYLESLRIGEKDEVENKKP